MSRAFLGVLALVSAAACGVWASACNRTAAPDPGSAGPPERPPSILIVTLDTTRADVVGPDAAGVRTPAFNGLAARGRRFRQAYATAPETLPSHSSMMTGLYPAGHGVHENARPLPARHAVLAEDIKRRGYRTGAFVSAFVLARRFGLARGFDIYDDAVAGGLAERSSRETTDRALAFLEAPSTAPTLLWVHYFDAHTPYAPADPFREEYAQAPYLGEVAAVDAQLARLVDAFERRAAGPAAIIVVGDHGEGLGDHGEAQHGNLIYQSTMHVPLVIVGPGVSPGVSEAPVSTRRIYHTVRDWAGLPGEDSLRADTREVVLGEGMKPFLEYGWQPQVMVVDGRQKAIFSGALELYDVVADPRETQDLAAKTRLSAAARKALDEYPVPATSARPAASLDAAARRQLASLGYVSSSTPPVIRKDAPRPVAMVHLFAEIDAASTLFVQEQYAKVIPLLESIRAADPFNLDAVLRLAIAHSALGRDAAALAAFDAAGRLAPGSPDVALYRALHQAKGRDWPQAVPVLERVVADSPERLPAIEALAALRERQGRLADVVTLREQIYALRAPTPAELVALGGLAMREQRTEVGIAAFERARAGQGATFAHDLELGVLYLAARRIDEARRALDRVPPSHRDYPMALFKRAQVSVLLGEPDRAARIAAARAGANGVTRPLIERERLFRPTP